MPVKLERSSAASRFRLRFHEDDPRLNATLLQFVKHDFDLTLPDFRDGLPQDGSGIDVLQVIEQFRHAVRDTPGFEVADDTALSTFSFAKYLMWKDLTDRTDSLRQNRVVKHLIDNPECSFEGADQPFPIEHEIDRNYAPADIVMPLPADSSQIAASLAAAQGRDFVIVGPPGTGKSQTIANMIATCLAARKTVLFVAEKTAALDVVYRRLHDHGLGDHCLDWREACAAMWPKSWFSSRRIRRLLGSYANARTAEPAIDLPLIRKLQNIHRTITRNILSDAPLAFNGLDTDCVALKQHLQKAQRLRASLVQLGEFAGDVQSVATSIVVSTDASFFSQ